ncbi:MAG: hypothetical protein PVJ33_04780 [Lysobacterales bacterium]|jgi:hypothetical protein
MFRARTLTPAAAPFLVHLLLTLALLAVPAWLHAESDASEGGKPQKLFESDDALQVTMVGPWRDIERDRNNQDPYPARLDYRDAGGQAVSLPITAERRGIKRQQVCRFPPIKLRFEKDTVKGTTFRGQKSLKMVTYCDRSSRYEQYNLLEMLSYRMYNQLTDFSFRVRPLSVTWKDAESGKSYGPRFGFLIEDDSDVAKRNGLEKLKIPRVTPTQLDAQLTSIFSLFQYMIGNVDWASLGGPDPEECCHNVKLISKEPLAPGDPIYPVPYDFDSAGIVDAFYAAPPDGLPIRSVTQRLYRGYCAHNSTLESARQLFLAKEDTMFSLLRNEPELNSGARRKAERYLERFFNTLKDPEEFREQITERCRK